MSVRERVEQIISETIAAEVERMQFSEIVGDDTARDEDGEYAVDAATIAEKAAESIAALDAELARKLWWTAHQMKRQYRAAGFSMASLFCRERGIDPDEAEAAVVHHGWEPS